MDKLKKQRKQTRRKFTLLEKDLEKKLTEEDPNLVDLRGDLEALAGVHSKLQEQDSDILDKMCDAGKTEAEMDKEDDETMDYDRRFQKIKVKVMDRTAKKSVNREDQRTSSEVKLPKITLRTFSGELSDWLPFWSQFKEIHERTGLPATSKFTYLLNSLVKGTLAHKIVSGYPVTDDNYQKAVDALEERYGDETLLLQVHIRELLKLFIQNIEAKKKMTLVEFHDELETHLKSLEALKFNEASPATILFPLVESCLPKEILMAWQRSPEADPSSQGSQSRLDTLRSFVKKEVRRQLNVEIAEKGFRSESSDCANKSAYSREKPRKSFKSKEDIPTLSGLKISDNACIFCDKGNHESKDCWKAMSMTRTEKEAIVKQKSVCYSCLKPGHYKQKCQARVKCLVCRKPGHLAVLCASRDEQKSSGQVEKEREPRPGPSSIQPDPQNPGTSLSGCANSDTCTDQVLLQTIMVNVGWEGRSKQVRLFMDPGSQRSYITKKLAEELDLPIMGREANRHSLFGGQQTEVTQHKTHHAVIYSLDGTYSAKVLLKGQEVICGPLPRLTEKHPVVKELLKKGIEPTDIGQGQPRIDILIGSDYYLRLLKGKMVQVGYGLTALETQLGWLVAGETRKRELGNSLAMTLLCMQQTEEDLSKLWQLEAIGISDPVEAIAKEANDKQIVAAFKSKIARKPDGRYVVPLPWKEGHPPLPDNRGIALKRLEATTRKLKKNENLIAYSIIFEDWENEGFIEEVNTATESSSNLEKIGCSKLGDSDCSKSSVSGCSKLGDSDCSNTSVSGCSKLCGCSKSSVISCSKSDVSGSSCSKGIGCSKSKDLVERVSNSCLRTHYIPHRPVFKDSLTTPVRPVFDASCKVGENVSLNDCLETGPSFVMMIPELLMRFREKNYGVISDIRKAFQMIEVVEEDRDACRFLWWKKDGSVQEYRHARVMFGATCSPFILGAVIDHHLNGVNEEQKATATKLLESMYVDNCVTSVDSKEEYEQFRDEATRIMAEAQMDLRLWMSNEDFLEDDEVVPVLGVQWNRNFDVLYVDPKDITAPDIVTKRAVLSTLAKIFDSIGFLSPALLPVKKILQRSWVLELKWDEELPREEKEEFLKFVDQLPKIKKIRIPRLVTQGVPDRSKWSLHLFTDASRDAYAAVVYLRVEGWSYVTVHMLAAKSRVAPAPTKKKKAITIPRAELMGTLIGSRLLASVRRALKMEDVPVFCWSDSTTALVWIKNEKPWGTFVGNRAREVRDLTDKDWWRHVPGEENIADLPSRGCSIEELKASRWWEGPEWLKKPAEMWPSREEEPDIYAINQELKKSAQVELASSNIETLTRRNLTFSQTVKMLAWIVRIQKNSRRAIEDRILSPQLSQEEISDAKMRLIKMMKANGAAANGVVANGVAANGVAANGTAANGEPLVSNAANRNAANGSIAATTANGVLCIKTRLSNRDDLAAFKFPMLLPKNHEMTRKLIEEEHIRHHHAGINFLMAKIREEYWIPQMRKIIKNVIRKCSRCYRFKVKCTSVIEAPLPLDRVKDTEVFDVVGVDLAGPFFMKNGSKAWIVLYTCAVYRAIHLDVVTSLSTQAFIKSLKNFVEMYHRPAIIYSDNGTNFHGANNLFKSLDWETIKKEKGIDQIQWKFNPPSAAWWGGWWERMVRSVKELLKRNLGRASLTLDEFKKVLNDVKPVINGRPLTYVSEDKDDLQPLTPAMFMNPAALLPNEFPEEQLSEPEKLRRRYRYLQQLKEELRRRFRNEYLGQLKSKPSKVSPELKVGDIVLLGADNLKRLDWPLARILELYPGKDKVERVALVKTKDGTYVRPVQRLYKMEMDDCTATEIKKSRRGRPIKGPDRLRF